MSRTKEPFEVSFGSYDEETDKYEIFVSFESRDVCQITRGYGDAMKNAFLLAASPVMLPALKRAKTLLESAKRIREDQNGGPISVYAEVMQEIQNAIDLTKVKEL